MTDRRSLAREPDNPHRTNTILYIPDTNFTILERRVGSKSGGSRSGTRVFGIQLGASKKSRGGEDRVAGGYRSSPRGHPGHVVGGGSFWGCANPDPEHVIPDTPPRGCTNPGFGRFCQKHGIPKKTRFRAPTRFSQFRHQIREFHVRDVSERPLPQLCQIHEFPPSFWSKKQASESNVLACVLTLFRVRCSGRYKYHLVEFRVQF